jgi:hypothetical protein
VTGTGERFFIHRTGWRLDGAHRERQTMRRYHHVGVLSSAPAPDEGRTRITVSRRLLGRTWTADVDAMEAAIARFEDDGGHANRCDVVFFEIASDGHLHVNVTHQHLTKAVPGWVGPGRVTDGFVHNRRFVGTGATQMIRHVRDMVFAPQA